MADEKIRFDDGAGYEQMMGKWSQLVGADFLDGDDEFGWEGHGGSVVRET